MPQRSQRARLTIALAFSYTQFTLVCKTTGPRQRGFGIEKCGDRRCRYHKEDAVTCPSGIRCLLFLDQESYRGPLVSKIKEQKLMDVEGNPAAPQDIHIMCEVDE
jgi:hypothetical protein